jgi:hypothetical protein
MCHIVITIYIRYLGVAEHDAKTVTVSVAIGECDCVHADMQANLCLISLTEQQEHLRQLTKFPPTAHLQYIAHRLQ